MSLQISVPKITLGGLVFETLQSEVNLNAGKLAVPFSAHMYGGKLNGALLVEAAKDQSINLSAKFDNIGVEKIQAVASHFSRGKASGQIELKTIGNSQYSWISKLQGQAYFSVKDGIVRGFDLHEVVGLLKKPSNLLDLKHLQSGFSGKGETAFSNASGKFTVVNGVASTNDLTIEATDAQIKAEGQADLLNWQMRFTGEVLVPSLKDLPPLKFTIKGPLDQPSYNLDLKQIQQLFVQKGAGDLVSKALGKSIPGLDKLIPGLNKKSEKAEPEASNSNAKDEDKPLKPEKVVKGLLKGIFG
jgi:AsmA protein